MRDQPADTPRQLHDLVERSNTERLRRAAQTRARGRAQYVLRYGILQLWLPLAIVAIAVLTLFTSLQPPIVVENIPLPLRWAVMLLPVGIAVGTVWGLWMWRLYERHWFALLDADQRVSPPAT